MVPRLNQTNQNHSTKLNSLNSRLIYICTSSYYSTYYIILYYIILDNIILHYIILYCIILYCIILYYLVIISYNTYIYIHISIYLSVCLFVCLSIYLYIYIYTAPYIHISYIHIWGATKQMSPFLCIFQLLEVHSGSSRAKLEPEPRL